MAPPRTGHRHVGTVLAEPGRPGPEMGTRSRDAADIVRQEAHASWPTRSAWWGFEDWNPRVTPA